MGAAPAVGRVAPTPPLSPRSLEDLLLLVSSADLSVVTVYAEGLRALGWGELAVRHHLRAVLSLPDDRRGKAFAAMSMVASGVAVDRVAAHVEQAFLVSIEERMRARAALAREVEKREARAAKERTPAAGRQATRKAARRAAARGPLFNPPPVSLLLSKAPAEEQERLRRFVDDLYLGGLGEEAIALHLARHLKLLPEQDPFAWRHLPRGPRERYMTHLRQVLLARTAIEPGRTCDLARASGFTWRAAASGLAALLELGHVERHEDEEGRKVWSVTKRGTAWLNRAPEIASKLAEGPVQALLLILERKDLRSRLRSLGWNYDQCRDVVPVYTIDYVTKSITEVVYQHHEGRVRNPGGLLWWRLGVPARARKKGRKLAGVFPTRVRWKLVETAIEAGKREADSLRVQGLAKKVVPDGLGNAFLQLVTAEPFYVARRLAYTLAKQARSGRTMSVSSVHETLHWIRKELAAHPRLSPEQRGEARE